MSVVPLLKPVFVPAPTETEAPVGHLPRITICSFCETPSVNAAITTAAGDRRMSRGNTEPRLGGIDAAIDFCSTRQSPDLLILESRAPRDMLLAQLARLAAVCDADTKVVVIGASNDVALYRELIDCGVADYMVAPVETLAVVTMILRLFSKPGAAKAGRICAFIGAKGGVGSSVVAQNLSWTIAQASEAPVLLVDMDLQFGTAALNLNLEATTGYVDQLADAARLDDALFDRLMVRRGKFLSVLPGGTAAREVAEPDCGVLDRMLDLAQSNFPLIVLDVPHAWSPWVRRTLALADEVILTVEPDLGNLRNAKSLISMLRVLRPNDAPARLLLNKVGMPKRSEIKAAEFAEALQIRLPDDLMGSIGFEPMLFSTAANNGQFLDEVAKRNPTARPFALLAQTMTGRKAPVPKRSFFRRLWRD